jgi:hypothetical protein
VQLNDIRVVLEINETYKAPENSNFVLEGIVIRNSLLLHSFDSNFDAFKVKRDLPERFCLAR